MQYLADTEKEKIGELVKEILIKLNITQAEIAEALGISAGTIKNILKGRAATFDIIIKVLRIFWSSSTFDEGIQTPDRA